MTLLELHKQTEAILRDKNNKNLITAVPAQGLCGNHVKIRDISCGFDWDAGLVLLHPEKPLTTVSLLRYGKLKDAYLRKISNLSKIQSGETLNAKYKSRSFVGRDKWDCVSWICGCFEEEFGEE